MRYLVFASILASVLFLGSALQAATLAYDFEDQDPDFRLQEGGTAANEIRATFIEVLAPVRFSRLGAVMRPNMEVDIDASWTVYQSNADDDVLGAVASFNADFSFASLDAPASLISMAVDVTLGPGFYLLALQTDAPLFYTHYRETPAFRAAFLPFTTADGALRVIEGGIINFAATDPSIIGGNVSLPAISATYDIVTSEPPAVPLPAGLTLILSALGGLFWLRRRGPAAQTGA